MGLAEKAANRTSQAIEAFSKALRLDEGRYDAAVELAGQYLLFDRYGEAAELLQRYEALMENSPLYLDMAATIYANVGLPTRAWPLSKKANELQPGIDSLQANFAACNVHVGKIDDARAIYSALLEKSPDHQRNHYELSRLGTAVNGAHVEQMKAVLRATNRRPAENIYIYYAIGKELEDLEQWDEAFEFYKLAGDAAASVADYCVETDIRLIDKVIEICDSGWLDHGAKAASPDPKGKTPIFIVGLPRSGTTLTERILSSHSRVESIGESFFVQIALKRESRVPTTDRMNPKVIESASTKDMTRIASRYMDAIDYRLGDKPLFIEKLPENFLYLGFIAKAFPDCRIVFVRRHPMDTCFAMYKQSFFRYAYSLDDLGAYYVAFHRLYEHWRRVLRGRMIEVEYEAMVGDQLVQTRKLLEQLGLGLEDGCLRFEENKTSSNTASAVQIREKIHTRSVSRWMRFEKQLDSLRSHLEDAGINIA